MKRRTVVIVGGGIAGFTLARLLAQDAHRVTVVERARDFSAQGHAIGFRGVGFQVLQKLGLDQAAQSAGRNFSGNRSFTLQGKPLRFTASADQAQAVGGVAVMLRGMLHAVLARDLPREIEIRFGLRPRALHNCRDGVVLELDDGSVCEGDILVGADGVNSWVRATVLPELEVLDYGGVYVGMMCHVEHGLPIGEISTFYGVARMIAFFPLDASRVAVVVYQDDSFGEVPTAPSPQSWAAYFKSSMPDVAPAITRVLEAIEPSDVLFFDRIRQVPAARAVAGRVTLVGDAGYCPTFLSGNGAALATLGAYCLTECLKKTDDDRQALEDYERRILPQARAYQANANRLRDILFTHSPLKLLVRRMVLQYAPTRMLMRDARRHYRGTVRIEEVVR